LISIGARSSRKLRSMREVLGLAEDLPDDDVITDLFPAVRAMVKMSPRARPPGPGAHRISGDKSRVQRAREKLKQILLECCHVEEEFYS
jgi:hypothetical protein